MSAGAFNRTKIGADYEFRQGGSSGDSKQKSYRCRSLRQYAGLKKETIMKIYYFILLALFISACTPPSILKYGYLPGADYEIYAPTQHINLQGEHFHYVFSDVRTSYDKVDCSDIILDKDSELEGRLGYDLFSIYLTILTDSCSGKTDDSSLNTIKIELQAISPKLTGFGFITVHGLVQFKVQSSKLNKIYCADVKDGDRDSPLGRYSFATRKTAMRELVSAACRKAIESFLKDFESSLRKAG
jgi:hypothetical protein